MPKNKLVKKLSFLMKFNHPLTKQDIVDIDRFSYDVTQNWFRRQKTEGLEYCGLHFGEIVRRYLWDKVSRALRKQYYPEAFAFENQLLSENNFTSGLSVPEELGNNRSLHSQFYLALNNTRHYLCTSYLVKSQPWRKVILTRTSARLARIVGELAVHSNFFILSPSKAPPAYRNCLQSIEQLRDSAPSESKVNFIWRAVIDGMSDEGIKLSENDTNILRHEIAYELKRIKIIDAYFRWHHPDAVLLDGDNWPPVLNFVLLARKYGIPSIHLQHGLDCEHFVLEEAYADAIAVWGRVRKERYKQNSCWQPSSLEVTGNPEFSHYSLPTSIQGEGKYWLWITRPHLPRKCLSPSRSPKEGLDILGAFVRVLKMHTSQVLLIKPHPKDYSDLYRAKIQENSMQDRIKVIEGPLEKWLPSASIVFSEDSTGGMEAMFFGKPLVHVHFSPSAPTMPFAEYEAGVPAYTEEALEDAVQRITKMNDQERNVMLKGHKRFLSDFAGPLDGKATQRMFHFVRTFLNSSS